MVEQCRRLRPAAFGALFALASALGLAPGHARAWCQMVTGNLRPSPEEPCVLAANHEGIHPLAWRRRCTYISISEALPPTDLTIDQVRATLETSFATWMNVDCGGMTAGLDVEVLTETNLCTESVHHSQGRNVHSIVFVRGGWSSDRGHDPRAYAVTYVWHAPESGEIYDADMEINESRGSFTLCPEAGCTDGRIDFQNVLTHEAGHYFGIAHTPDDPLATMHASAPAGETIKRTLTADDTDALCTMYPPGSLPAACDPTPRGGLDLTCAPGDGCGCRAPGSGRRAPTGAALLATLALAAWALGQRVRHGRRA